MLHRHPDVTIHPSANVADSATIGEGTRIWHQAQVRDGASIGRECVLGKGVYVDTNVHVGDRCKIENGANVFHGFDLEDGVFIGPGALLLNDKNPRAINPDGSLKDASDWVASKGRVGRGASIGGGAVLLPGIAVGSFALVGSGAVVTRDVADHAIVVGNPARQRGFACFCGQVLGQGRETMAAPSVAIVCAACGSTVTIDRAAYEAGAKAVAQA